MPPGWGRPRWVAATIGTFGALASALVLVLTLRSGTWDPEPPFSHDVAHHLGAAKPIIAVLAALALVGSIWEVAWAMRDVLARPNRVTGVVVGRWIRKGRPWNPWGDLVPRHYYLAVDDGTSRRIRGWRVSQAQLAALQDGDVIEATVTPNLGTVLELRRAKQR